jgi:hypothetical protein
LAIPKEVSFMKSSRTLAVLGVAASLAVLGAMISPVATNAATPESRTPAAHTQVVTTVSTPSAHVSAKKARAIVAHAVPKARFVSIKSTEHGGTATFAVKMKRVDDSSVTGYVDEESGDILDWAENPAPVVRATAAPSATAPAPQADGTTSYDDDSDDGDSDDDQTSTEESAASSYDDDGDDDSSDSSDSSYDHEGDDSGSQEHDD